MRKRIIKRMQQMQQMLPNKVLRREKFVSRIKNRKRHQKKYNAYSYQHSPKASRFNRWQDYKRFNNRAY